jgi:hypothetical protein
MLTGIGVAIAGLIVLLADHFVQTFVGVVMLLIGWLAIRQGMAARNIRIPVKYVVGAAVVISILVIINAIEENRRSSQSVDTSQPADGSSAHIPYRRLLTPEERERRKQQRFDECIAGYQEQGVFVDADRAMECTKKSSGGLRYHYGP